MSADPKTDAVALLRSIDKRLETLVAIAFDLVKQAKPAAVASDADLDGKYGDPLVRFDPRDWTGPSFKGRRMSECPAEFLDLYAQAKDYYGDKAEREQKLTEKGKPAAQYERADAARARGWAKRVLDGRVPAAASANTGWAEAPSDDDIPF